MINTSLSYNYVYVFLLGTIGKVYDDMVDLYFIKNERIKECVKTLWTISIFYFIFVISTNGYDILLMLFIWTFLPLFDWNAFTGDPYFFSLLVFINIVGFIKIKKYKFNLFYIGIAFVLYTICSPITEALMFEMNGPVSYIYEFLNITKKKDMYNMCKVKKEELECSNKKLITRIISILFLLLMIILCNYLKSNTKNEELQNVYISVNYLSILNIGYFIISVISQVYKLYFIKNNKQIINNIVVNECNKSKKNKKKIKNKSH